MLFFYLFGLIGLLVATWIFTTQGDLAEFAELPTATSQPTTDPTANSNTSESAPCTPTSSSIRYGYISNAPITTTLVPDDLILPGSPLIIFGTIYASDCVTPLPNILVEVWHADVDGQYDNSPPFILRGQMRTDAKGRYQFTSIKPGRSIVGSETVPANIHYRVSYKDYPPLYTQLFFAGDPLLARVPLTKPPLITTLTEQVGAEGTILVLRGKFDIVLPVLSPNASSR